MKPTIENLWYGNIAPCERCGARDPQIKDLIALMSRNKETLNKLISPQEQEIFEKYIDCAQEYVIRMTEQAFCEGFRLASNLLGESLFEDW